MADLFGGDINKNKAFSKILSIGYELETSHLIKFTELNNEIYDELSNQSINILLNTDTARYDIDILLNYDEQSDEKKAEYAHRLVELIELPTKKNTTFHITNDIADTKMEQTLKTICNNEYDKNIQYQYRTNDGKSYAIQFAHWDTDTECSVFSDVEWVATYYKPRQQDNIILYTFTQTIRKLISHLHELIPVKGELVYIPPEDEEEGEDETGISVGKYDLYHMPNSNLHYMKLNAGNIDNIRITAQMTFSAHVSDAFYIMKNIAKDNSTLYECLTVYCGQQLKIMSRIETCILELIRDYNKDEPIYKISSTESSLSQAETTNIIKCICNYMALILYKLCMYYNVFLQSTKYKTQTKDDPYYLKKALSFNCRHNNYQLYIEIKKCLIQLFADKFARQDEATVNAIVATIIKRIFLQPELLYKYLLSNKTFVRKGAFLFTNILEKSHKQYGSPTFSLASYFDFFENPADEDTNLYEDDSIITHDWLEYKDIDAYSAKMDIKDNIILIENRNFAKLMKNHVIKYLKIKSSKESQIMTYKSIGNISVSLLADFIEKYDQMHRLSITSKIVTRQHSIDHIHHKTNKTRKTRKVKSL